MTPGPKIARAWIEFGKHLFCRLSSGLACNFRLDSVECVLVWDFKELADARTKSAVGWQGKR